MKAPGLAPAGQNLSKGILLSVVFVGLNLLDARLTGAALALGSSEANPIVAMGFGSSMVLKGLVSFAVVVALVLFKQGKLLKPLDFGMLVVVLWNGLAVWSWS